VDSPELRFVETVDGVHIAYWTAGEGAPFVYLGGWPFEHIMLELQRPVDIELYTHLATYRTLVRYDGRGSGSSHRDVSDIGLNARVLDLAAVVGQIAGRPIALLGFQTTAPVAIVFAARHPELVSELILYDAHADFTAVSQQPQTKAVTGLMRANWEMFTETLAGLGYGFGTEGAREYAAFARACTSQDNAIRAIGELSSIDVRHLLPELTMPVLVLQHRDTPYNGTAVAQAIVDGIPNGTLRFLEGNYAKNPSSERGPIAEFLGAPPLDPVQARTMTIMFTDIVDSTAIAHRHGDEKAQELLRAHNNIVRDAIKSNLGSEVKHTGDGIMASFLAAPRALSAGVQIQRSVAAYNETAEMPLELRVGINAGQPVVEDADLFGSAVNLAARVCSVSEGGQILVTEAVRLLSSEGFAYVDKGPATLRGFEEPIPLFAVDWSVGS
jgi:class 3 adenylate cyclase